MLVERQYTYTNARIVTGGAQLLRVLRMYTRIASWSCGCFRSLERRERDLKHLPNNIGNGRWGEKNKPFPLPVFSFCGFLSTEDIDGSYVFFCIFFGKALNEQGLHKKKGGREAHIFCNAQ